MGSAMKAAMPLLHVRKEAGDPETDAQKEAAAIKATFEKLFEKTATKEELEALESRIKEGSISREDVLDACKSAIDAHLAQTKDANDVDPELAEWKDMGQGVGFVRTVKLPTMHQFHKALSMQKSQAAANITGAPVGAIDVSAALATGNPYRMDIMVMGMNEGSIKIPVLPPKAFRFTASGNKPESANDNTETGSTDLVAGEADARIDIGNPALQDLPGIRAVIEFELTQRFSTAQGERVFAAMKASVAATTAGTAGRVATGQASALPADPVAATADVVAAVPAPYRMDAQWHISRALESSLNKATTGTGGEYAFNPSLGIMQLHGYPVRVNDLCDSGNAAGDVSATFGSHRNGVILGERKDLEIQDNPFTRPGWRTFYACGRFEAAMWHPTAVAGLVTRAT